jgi:O-acetyl-ADP-ribose deacetylase (regulator of RNase III)
MSASSAIEIIEADITTLDVDAIVNAANERMLGGGGVDGAIHRAAGPQLYEECKRVPEVRPGVRCPTGEARLTKAYNLPARFVIHTVGPVWQGGGYGEDEALSNCYRNSLKLAEEHQLKSIAFPAISTGIYGFPLHRATKIAVREAREFLKTAKHVRRIIFVCFGHDAFETYQRELTKTTSQLTIND